MRNPGPERVGTKPIGGLWFSPEREHGETAWSLWCRAERFARLGTHGYRFVPELGARLFLVETPFDRQVLIHRYSRPDSDGVFLRLDWERIARDYDGLYLTAQMLEHDLLHTPMAFYGWDCESGVWFKPTGFRLEPWRRFDPIVWEDDDGL